MSEPFGLVIQSLVRSPEKAAALECCRGFMAAVVLPRLNMSRFFVSLLFLELVFCILSNALYVHPL